MHILLFLVLPTQDLSGDWIEKSADWWQMESVGRKELICKAMLLQIREDRFCLTIGYFLDYEEFEGYNLSSGDGYRAWWGEVKREGDQVTLVFQGFWESRSFRNREVKELAFQVDGPDLVLKASFNEIEKGKFIRVKEPILYVDQGVDTLCSRFQHRKQR